MKQPSRAMRTLSMAVLYCMTLLLTATLPTTLHAQSSGCNQMTALRIPNNPGGYEPNTPAHSTTMPASVQRILTDAQQTTKIGTLPNGDRIYLATGIGVQPDTAPQYLGNGMTVVSRGYITHECLLLYSSHFGQWDVLTFNPSIARDSSFTITEAHIQPDWNIAVTFTSKKRVVHATYLLAQERFVYKNAQEEEWVEGRIPGVYFGSVE